MSLAISCLNKFGLNFLKTVSILELRIEINYTNFTTKPSFWKFDKKAKLDFTKGG